jgi:phospholipase/carboxylesterase
MSTNPPIEIETGPNPRASIIILHGLGADGSDFVPIAKEFDLDAVGPVRFIFPHAPRRPITINRGMTMPGWYDVFSNDFVRTDDEPGMKASQATIDAIIAKEVARGIPANRIVLSGFSQGCAMTLMAGLRHPARLAGLAGLSGYLPLTAQLAAERSPANQDVPIFLAHGKQDPVIDFDRAVMSRNDLQKLGYSVEWHEYPMPHTVCMEEVEALNAFLLKVLA